MLPVLLASIATTGCESCNDVGSNECANAGATEPTQTHRNDCGGIVKTRYVNVSTKPVSSVCPTVIVVWMSLQRLNMAVMFLSIVARIRFCQKVTTSVYLEALLMPLRRS